MVSKAKRNVILLMVIVAIILAILIINYFKGLSNGQDAELKCIAENSLLYVSKTCSHCAQQKSILGEGIKYFNMTDCLESAEKTEYCAENNITSVPSWIINNTKYTGVKSIGELKSLTGC